MPLYPVCDGQIDNAIGIIHSHDILQQTIIRNTIDLESLVREVITVPETAITADVMNMLQDTATKVAIVIDEHGGFAGIVSEKEISQEILGQFEGEAHPVQRSDGSWLFDGSIAIDEIQHFLPGFGNLAEDGTNHYYTLAGFVLAQLGHIPATGEKFTWQSFSIEVVDMDDRHVDKVLISPIQEESAQHTVEDRQ